MIKYGKLTRCICLVLIIAMLLPIGVSASSTPVEAEITITQPLQMESGYDVGEVAREAYYNLSPEARALYDQIIAQDPELLEFHRRYVNPEFQVSVNTQSEVNAYASSLLTELANNLAALSLPVDVENCLNSMGAGMVAAGTTISLGAVLAAAASVLAVKVIANNWNSVSSGYDRIVRAFTSVFTSATAAITDAFDDIKETVPAAQTAARNGVRINGHHIIIGDLQYDCTATVSSLTDEQVKNKRYFIALRVDNNIYVDLGHPLSQPGALAILVRNDSRVGVVAVNKTYARAIAGKDPKGPEIHGGGGYGYYYHYHNTLFPDAHIWYPSQTLALSFEEEFTF